MSSYFGESTQHLVCCAFSKFSIIAWSSSCTSPCPDSSQGSLEFRWSPGYETQKYLRGWLQLIVEKTSVSLARLAFPFLQLSAATSFFGVKIFCTSNAFAAWTKLMKTFHIEHPKNVFFFADMALLLLKLLKNFCFAQEAFLLQQHKQWEGRENSSWESLLTILPSVWPPVLLRPLPTGHMWIKKALRPP